MRDSHLLKWLVLVASIAFGPALAGHGAKPSRYTASALPAGPLKNDDRDLPDHPNGCLEQTLVGETMPLNSRSLQDVYDFCGMLEIGLQPGFPYQNLPSPESADLVNVSGAADARSHSKVYLNHCTSCHIDY